MEILHFEDLGDTSVVSECSLGVNLVIDKFFLCSFGFYQISIATYLRGVSTLIYNLKEIR